MKNSLKRAGLIVLVIAMCIQFIPLTAQAHTEEGTLAIDGGHYKVYSILFDNGDELILNYSIYVMSGSPVINIYLVDSENYGNFLNGEPFQYYSKGSSKQTSGITTGNITFTTHNTYYIIIDNTENIDAVTVYYDISYNIYEVKSSSGGNNTGAIIGGVVGVIIIFVIIAVILGMKKKRNIPLPTKPSEPVKKEENTKFCPYCGREIPADATVCPYCGHKL